MLTLVRLAEELFLPPISRDIVSVYIGARDEAGTRKLWNSLPPVYRQCAIAYTTFGQPMEQLYRASATLAVGKKTSKTS